MARNGTNGPEKFLIELSREFIDVESLDTSAVVIILLSSPVDVEGSINHDSIFPSSSPGDASYRHQSFPILPVVKTWIMADVLMGTVGRSIPRCSDYPRV